MTKEQMDECVAIIHLKPCSNSNKMKLRELFFPLTTDLSTTRLWTDCGDGRYCSCSLARHQSRLSPWLDGYFLSRKLGVYLFFIISIYLLDKQIIQVWQQGKGNGTIGATTSDAVSCAFSSFLLTLITFRLMNEAGYKVVIREWSTFKEHCTNARRSHFLVHSYKFRYYLISPLLLWLCYVYSN